MNTQTQRQLLSATKGMPLPDCIVFLVEYFWNQHREPLTDSEMEERGAYLKSEHFPHWYHGGLSGREVGEELLPSRITGHDPFGYQDQLFQRQEFVWVSPYLHQASSYARFIPTGRGSVYRVQPSQDLSISRSTWRMVNVLWSDAEFRKTYTGPKSLYYEFCCSKAEVLEVVL